MDFSSFGLLSSLSLVLCVPHSPPFSIPKNSLPVAQHPFVGRLSTQPQPPLRQPSLQRLLSVLRLDPAQEPVSALLHQPRRPAHRRARAAADLGAEARKGRVGGDQRGGREEVEDFAVDAGDGTSRSGGGRTGGGRGDSLGRAEDWRRTESSGTEGGEDGEGAVLRGRLASVSVKWGEGSVPSGSLGKESARLESGLEGRRENSRHLVGWMCALSPVWWCDSDAKEMRGGMDRARPNAPG